MRLSHSAVLLSLLLAAGSAFTQPAITSIKPPHAAAGDPVEIVGSGFGSERGAVKFNGKRAKISNSNWTDVSIRTVVPSGVDVGNVVVDVTLPTKGAGAAAATTAVFLVDLPEYDPTHFEVLTGVGAVLAGAEVTSYKIDNDALSSSNVGRKTPEILLGGGFILPWRGAGGWIERAYCGTKNQVGKEEEAKQEPSDDCKPGGAYYRYRPWETFLSIRFAPTSDQTINGFVLGGGYRITKYFSVMIGYSVTPVDEPSPGFRVAAAQIVTANPTIAPYNRYNAADLLSNKPGAFDGFPLKVYDANGITTQNLFPSSPRVTHHRSGIYFGVGIPLNLTALFKPGGK